MDLFLKTKARHTSPVTFLRAVVHPLGQLRQRFGHLILLPTLVALCSDLWVSVPQRPERVLGSLQQHVHTSHESPEDFVVRQFRNHSIIFLGEMHGVRQNLEFLQRLIPRLYAAGVYNLGYEFSSYSKQAIIEKLITANQYDPRIANELLFDIDLTYVTEEYAGVYRAAWEFNRTLSREARRFRIVALNPDETSRMGWGGQELNIHDWTNIFWAQVISREFIAKKEKALIYSGSGHSYTRFFFQRKQDNSIAAGNLIYNMVRDQVMTIILHGDGGLKRLTEQVDAIMDALPASQRQAGLETRGTLLGQLSVPYRGYLYDSERCSNFTLADVADGYIYLTRRTELAPVRFIRGFITATNFTRIEERWRREHPRDREYSKQELEDMAADNWQHLQEVFR